MSRRLAWAAPPALIVLLAGGGTAHAHGFGERYDLPVPLSLYVGGAGLVVALSFVVAGLFVRSGATAADYPRYNLLGTPLGRLLASRPLREAIRTLGVAILGLYLVAGFAGSDDPNANPAPVLTWVWFWVGLAYASALAGNLWALLNPWNALFGWAEGVCRILRKRPPERLREYPDWLGAWPSVGLFLVFAWIEIIDPGASSPSRLATLVAVYSVLTLGGMAVFGRHAWMKNAEVFSLVFGLMARLSPTETRTGEAVDDYEALEAAGPDERQWNVRWWGTGLLAGPTPSFPLAALVVLVLASVTFDGLRETSPWISFASAGAGAFGALGDNPFVVAGTLGLMATPLAFGAAFAGVAWLMGRLGQGDVPLALLMRTSVYALIPIALAYHVAHFLSFLLIQGQFIIPIASDPFGLGWDLFGTAGYVVDIGVVNARFAWFAGVAAIVLGHVAGIFAAHAYALRLFASRSTALRSQYPMLVLMVGYTMVSLWIVAQPITEPP